MDQAEIDVHFGPAMTWVILAAPNLPTSKVKHETARHRSARQDARLV